MQAYLLFIQREDYYNRDGWGVNPEELNEEGNDILWRDLLEREKGIQRRYEDRKVRESRCNWRKRE